MRILQLYNNYQSGGRGETRVVELIEQVLRDRNNDVKTVVRDSKTIKSTADKIGLLFTGIYSPSARKEIHREIVTWRPDVVHVHNLYPLFSPSVLTACRELGVPVVMSVHNYGLSCPVATHFRDGKPCQLCIGGHEYHCVEGNCKDDLFKSTAYALRSYVAGVAKQFRSGVDVFLAVSGFVKDRMIEAGYPSERIQVLENAVPIPDLVEENLGEYVAYLGGMTTEKGVDTLLAAAARLPQCRFLFAGDGPDRSRWAASASPNCTFVGRQDRRGVEEIYRKARFTVVPSIWWEPFGLVAIEAMSYGKAVIAARSGALTELVEDGVTGLTFAPGHIDGLTQAIHSLWSDPVRAKAMGQAGRVFTAHNFNLSNYADRLLSVYEQVQMRTGKPETA